MIKTTQPNEGRWARLLLSFLRETDGKITIFAIPWVFGLGILICFIGNSGEIAGRRIQAQNAADAAAYSLSLLQARGMNTITTINHIMGDITALNVTIDALGGSELDDNWNRKEVKTNESQTLIDAIKKMTTELPTGTIPGAYANLTGSGQVPPFHEYEQQFLEQIGKQFYETREYATASIYDARMVLKSHLALILFNKMIVSGIIDVIAKFPPLAFLDPLSIAFHAGLDLIIVELTKEWKVLQALEFGCAMMKPFKVATRSMVLPVLSMIGDHVAGQYGISPIQKAMEETIKELEADHKMDKILVYPPLDEFLLPVRQEEKPDADSGKSGSSAKPDSEWQGQFDLDGGILKNGLKLMDSLKSKLDRVASALKSVPKKFLPDAAKQPLEKLDDVSKLKTAFDFNPNQKNWPENPSPENLPSFDCEKERVTQWVRASAPPLDHYRAIVRQTLQNPNPLSMGAPISNAAYFFTHWSNKYLLAESYRVRSGKYKIASLSVNIDGAANTLSSVQERLSKLKENLGDLSDTDEIDRLQKKVTRLSENIDNLNNSVSGTPHMQILVDATPYTKGKEPWRTNKAILEENFCLLAAAKKKLGTSLYLPGLFSRKGSDIEAFAQAIVYNANDLYLPDSREFQPNSGWDTLNWNGKARVPDWSGFATDTADGNLPDLFRPNRLENFNGRSIRLNWQSKLVPISKRVVGWAAQSEPIRSDFQKGLKDMTQYFPLSCY